MGQVNAQDKKSNDTKQDIDLTLPRWMVETLVKNLNTPEIQKSLWDEYGMRALSKRLAVELGKP